MDLDKKSIGLAVLAVLFVVAALFGLNQSNNANELAGKVETLNTDLASKDTTISQLEQSMEDIFEQVNTLQGEVTEISNLQAQIEKLRADKVEVERVAALRDTEDRETINALKIEVDRLTQEALNKVDEPVVNEDDFEGKVLDDLSLGSTIGVLRLDDSDVGKLADGKVEFDNEKYDYQEQLWFSTDVQLGINGFPQYDEEFAESPYLLFMDTEAIVYSLVFDDVVPYGDIEIDESFEVTFLGEEWEIVGAKSDEITIRTGTKFGGNPGATFAIDGQVIEIVSISEGSEKVVVAVDGVTGVIEEGDTDKINGVEITANLIVAVHSDDYARDYAELTVGVEVEREIGDGDEFIEDDDTWVFNILEDGAGNFEEFQLVLDIKSDELSDDFKPLSPGEGISLPNNYLNVMFAGITDVDYAKYTFSFDDIDSDGDLTYDTFVVVLEASENDGIVIDNEEVDELYIERTVGNVWNLYYVEDGDLKLATDSTALLEYNDYTAIVSFETGGTHDILITEPTGKVIRLDVRPLDEKLGDIQEDAEADEVKYDGYSIGGKEEKVLLESGAIVDFPEDNGDEDEFVLLVPDDIVEAVITVG